MGVTHCRQVYNSKDDISIIDIEMIRNRIKMKFKSMIEQFVNMYLKKIFSLKVIFALDYFCDFLDAKETTRTMHEIKSANFTQIDISLDDKI